MKKIMIIATGLLCPFLLFSCNQYKYHPCTCTTTYNGQYLPVDAGPVTGTKAAAKHKCTVGMKARYEAAGYVNVTCSVPR